MKTKQPDMLIDWTIAIAAFVAGWVLRAAVARGSQDETCETASSDHSPARQPTVI